jgi:hypothetical protein
MRWAIPLLLLPTLAAAEPATRGEMIALIQQQRAQLFRDPDSLKETAVGRLIRREGLTLVCLQTNAKNGFGGYAGLRQFIVVLENGKLDLTPGRFTESECGPWQPAPELDGKP